jgi:cytochrome c oxidase subunit 4
MTRTYLLVWTGLMVLLASTIGASYLPLGDWSTPVSMLIALLKAGLIATFYMSLNESSVMVRFFASGALAWLLILFGMTLCDVLSRSV